MAPPAYWQEKIAFKSFAGEVFSPLLRCNFACCFSKFLPITPLSLCRGCRAHPEVSRWGMSPHPGRVLQRRGPHLAQCPSTGQALPVPHQVWPQRDPPELPLGHGWGWTDSIRTSLFSRHLTGQRNHMLQVPVFPTEQLRNIAKVQSLTELQGELNPICRPKL